MNDKILFLSNFIKSPSEVGSVTPSSRFMIERMLRNIDFDEAKCIAEYGPGTGCITSELLKRARGDARIFCFETNPKFYEHLKARFRDKRLILINDSAVRIMDYLKKHRIRKADYVVSVLALFSFGKRRKNKVMAETRKALGNSGKFIFIRYIPNFELFLDKYFSRKRMSLVLWNLPPSIIYVCEK